MGIKIPIIMINNRIAQSKTSKINGAYLILTQKRLLMLLFENGVNGADKISADLFYKDQPPGGG